MNPPIQLSLAGDRRLVVLTPQTVVKGYFQFVDANPEYQKSQRYRLNIPLYRQPERSIIDALHDGKRDRFHDRDIRQIEDEINRQIIEHKLALVTGEGKLLEGYGQDRLVGKNRDRVKYIIRYGLIFILESIELVKIISRRNIDLFWQDRDFNFHYVRYRGLRTSPRRQRVEMLISDRLDLTKCSTYTREEFHPRQIFTISAIYPCTGFRLVNLRSIV